MQAGTERPAPRLGSCGEPQRGGAERAHHLDVLGDGVAAQCPRRRHLGCPARGQAPDGIGLRRGVAALFGGESRLAAAFKHLGDGSNLDDLALVPEDSQCHHSSVADPHALPTAPEPWPSRVGYHAWMEPARLSAWLELPGVVHGFGRRPDVSESREQTRARVAGGLRPSGHLQLLRQVHGTTLAVAPCADTPTADAAGAERPGVLLGIETADCLPVLFIDPRRRFAAAAHAGWRGTAAGIVRHVVDWLKERGSTPEDLRVALGPCIGPCCYEVGDDLRPQFAEEDRVFFRTEATGRPHLDVRAINERQLIAAGVPRANIDHVRECTRCRPDLYCSYRGEGAGTGRMISYVGWSRL
jgi:YfiH family protein